LTWARPRPIIAPPLTPADLPPWFPLAAAGLFGACLGSFLNVVIARVPEGRSVVRPGSACPRCRAEIRWYDNVPVLSWLLLRARCRSCGQPISARYPLVELVVAGAAVLSVWRHGPGWAAVAELAFMATLVALAAIDLDTWLLPHALTLPLIALGLLASALGLTPARTLASAALGAATGGGLFWLVSVVGTWVFKREAMGFGDVVLLAGIGAFLGLPALLPVILLSSLQGALVGVVQLWLGRAQPGPAGEAGGRDAPPAPDGEADDWVPPRHALPFGPFLALAALEWLLWRGTIAAAVPGLDLFL
jgi:leader peptidase (prepilin peptidase)/N-methyltransferase